MRDKLVAVKVTEWEGEATDQNTFLPRGLFEERGLAHQGARFVYRLLRQEGGSKISVVDPDPDWEKVLSTQELRARMLQRRDQAVAELEVAHD